MTALGSALGTALALTLHLASPNWDVYTRSYVARASKASIVPERWTLKTAIPHAERGLRRGAIGPSAALAQRLPGTTHSAVLMAEPMMPGDLDGGQHTIVEGDLVDIPTPGGFLREAIAHHQPKTLIPAL
jgi:hypothetical protein